MDDWIDYYDSTHTIYASRLHRDLHFQLIAKDIVGYITSPDAVVLDLCCGTGDLAFHLARSDRSLNVTGIDFCEPMLEAARARSPREGVGNRVLFEAADAMALPFEAAAFDGATMGFSMRNVVDIGATLREVLVHESVRSATMVDLDGELVDLCRQYLDAFHMGAFDDPRGRLIIGDGRA